jgi:hypothetical protein
MISPSRESIRGNKLPSAMSKGVDLKDRSTVFDKERDTAIPAALGKDHAFRFALGNLDIRRDYVWAVRQNGRNPIRETFNALTVYEGLLTSVLRRGHIAVDRKKWIDLIPLGFFIVELLQFSEFFGIFVREIVCLAEVFVEVVELPRMKVIVQRKLLFRAGNSVGLPGIPHKISGPPSVLINGTVPASGEVLEPEPSRDQARRASISERRCRSSR